jgi:glutamyl-tRNA synthetase
MPDRVRFAPSPTGKLHVGGARTALFNWAWARREGGRFVLRIEDTDPKRSRREHEQAIYEGLRWIGLDWDEGPDVGGPFGPYRQSERVARHRERAALLLESGHAYRDFTPAPAEEPEPGEGAEGEAAEPAHKKRAPYRGAERELSAEQSARRAAAGEPFVLRFKVPEGRTRFQDLIRGAVEFDNREVDDWVVLRSDESPTYNFVVVCDDVDMRIDLVLRGEEHLVNTPKQVLLYRALGAEPPRFGHLPLMLGTDGKKLSKRTGDTALLDYRDKGYPPEAVANFLCLQGWALDGQTEVFSLERFVRAFDPRDVSKGGSIFDTDKLSWLAGEYVKADDPARLAERCAPWVVRAGLLSEAELAARADWFRAVVAGMRERFRLYSELPERIAFLFAEDEAVPYREEAERAARKHERRLETLAAFSEFLRPRLAAGEPPATVREAARAFVAERGLRFPELFQPLRCALTGEAQGPDLFEVIAWLGAERALARLAAGIRRLG